MPFVSKLSVIDLFIFSIYFFFIIVPTDESILLRYVIETLFIIHGESKLNMICPIGVDPEKRYGQPYDHQWFYHIKNPEQPTPQSILALIETIQELNERPSNHHDDDDDHHH